MGLLHEAERKVWGALTGVHKKFGTAVQERYRPVVWRPATPKKLGSLAVTHQYKGVPGATGLVMGRRKWEVAAIVVPDPTEWKKILSDNPEGRVMLAATAGKKLWMLGDLASREDVGYYHSSEGLAVPAHALRMGEGNARFAMAVQTPDGELVGPSNYIHLEYDNIANPDTDLPARKAHVAQIGMPGTAWEHVNIS